LIYIFNTYINTYDKKINIYHTDANIHLKIGYKIWLITFENGYSKSWLANPLATTFIFPVWALQVPNFRNKGWSAAPDRGWRNYHFLIGRCLWLYPAVIAVSLSDLGGLESEQTRTRNDYNSNLLCLNWNSGETTQNPCQNDLLVYALSVLQCDEIIVEYPATHEWYGLLQSESLEKFKVSDVRQIVCRAQEFRCLSIVKEYFKPVITAFLMVLTLKCCINCTT